MALDNSRQREIDMAQMIKDKMTECNVLTRLREANSTKRVAQSERVSSS